MKKFMTAVLIAAMLGTMAGCGSSTDTSEATTEYNSEEDLIDIDINAADYVELGQYKGLTIEGTKVEITDEDVESEIEDTLEQYSEYQEVTDRDTVKDGDAVNVDYTCTVDGETVDDYSESQLDIVIGSGELNYGENLDLETALIGKKVGSEVTVDGTFSDEDDGLGYAGQDAEFVITINAIEEEVVPELTDEFVKENLEYNTVAEYKKALREDLKEQAQTEADSENQSALWEKVVANSKQIKDFPQDAIEDEEHNTVIEEREMASYMGLEFGESDEEIDEYFQEYYECSLEDYAKDYLFRQCVLDLIVEKENLQPSDDEIDAAIEEEKEAGEYESVEDVLEYSSRQDFEDQIIYERVMDLLEKNSTIK